MPYGLIVWVALIALTGMLVFRTDVASWLKAPLVGLLVLSFFWRYGLFLQVAIGVSLSLYLTYVKARSSEHAEKEATISTGLFHHSIVTKHSKIAGVIISVIFIMSLIAASLTRPKAAHPFFSPAPAGISLQYLGSATNYLKLDHAHHWQAFCVSNGTSKTLFCTVTEVEYLTNDTWHSAGSWISNTLSSTSLMTRNETSGEIPPGTTDVFYATVSMTHVPWRLRVGCFENNSSDTVGASIGKLKAAIQGKSPLNVKSWSGARYELISGSIDP